MKESAQWELLLNSWKEQSNLGKQTNCLGYCEHGPTTTQTLWGHVKIALKVAGINTKNLTGQSSWHATSLGPSYLFTYLLEISLKKDPGNLFHLSDNFITFQL